MFQDWVNSRGLEEPDTAESAGIGVLEGVLQHLTEAEKAEEDFPPLPGNEGHRLTITPFHGEIEDPGEHGYRRVPVLMDQHDPSHDLDDPDPDTNRFSPLTELLKL